MKRFILGWLFRHEIALQFQIDELHAEIAALKQYLIKHKL